jgi:DNA gyrase/topoisomerase IV subunit A
MLRLKVRDISASGRATRGFKLMDLGTDDKVAAIARINNTVVPRGNGETE